jgi:HlyD family secretion protein
MWREARKVDLQAASQELPAWANDERGHAEMAVQTDEPESKEAPVAPPTPTPYSPKPGRSPPEKRSARRAPAILATLSVVAIVGLSLWYLAQPQPLLVQGEADATRIDIAARVDGRVGKRPVERGDNVTAGQVLYEIDNPELLTRLREAEASLAVASANLANIEAGARAEDIAQRKAARESAEAQLTLAQQTYVRIKQLADSGNAPMQQLDQATNSLKTAQSAVEQAKFAYDEAVAGPTKEQRDIAHANVADAQAKVNSIRAQVDELVVKAPIAAQVYQIGAELGEYVSPGVPLLTLVDLSDVWLRFDLREDLVKRIAVGKKAHDARPGARRRTDRCGSQIHRAKGRVCRLARHRCSRVASAKRARPG